MNEISNLESIYRYRYPLNLTRESIKNQIMNCPLNFQPFSYEQVR